MKNYAAILIAALLLPCAANAANQWRVFVRVPPDGRNQVVEAVGSALAPLGFRRDTTSLKQHPINLLRDLVAMYEAGTYADASIFKASSSGCFHIAVENFDETRTNLVKSAQAAVEGRLRESLGKSVAFFSGPQCTHAL